MIFTPIQKRNNMNVVRYYLALCILMNHFNVLTAAGLPTLPRIFGGVGSFFALSGFLMFPSYERHNNLKGYALRRLKRILPPYIFIVILAAFALSVLSSLPLQEYFTNPQFFKYLICNLLFMNFMEPALPGVFEGDMMLSSAVNGALWTMKGELFCYLMVPFIYNWLKKRSESASRLLTTLMGVSFIIYMGLVLAGERFGIDTYVLAKQFRLFTFFFAGALINVNFAKFKRYKWQILGLVIAMIAVASLNDHLYMTLRPFSDSMLVIWCSMIGSWGAFLSRYNSISYQVYLFHWPIIQVLVACGVTATLGNLWSLALAILLSFLLALLSWILIDRPILKGKTL